jgi:elongation factor Tu
MIESFRYRTTIGNKEFQHTIHSENIESSISKWIVQLEDLKDQVYSFDEKIFTLIKNEFDSDRIKFIKDDKLSYLNYVIDNKNQLTYIDSIKKGLPDLTANMQYLTTEDGGRKGYATSGYRPHLQIKEIKEMTSAEQLFVNKDKVHPGESVLAEIRILGVKTFEGLLYEGLKFKLGEGNRIVAEGVIKEVINKKLLKESS